jgi:hypothetical protein
MAEVLHALQHRFGWWSGHVVSRTENGRIYIGFMCNTCCKVMSEHDATNIIYRHIDAHLVHSAMKVRKVATHD